MYRNITKYIILGIIEITIAAGFSMAQDEPNNSVILKAMPKATKGFPLVIKVTVRGPNRIDDFDIYDYGIPMTVHLISKSDGKEYIIQSQNTATTYGVPEPTINVPEGQKYTMMFDLWSIVPSFTPTTFLSDVPAGKYSVYIEFHLDRLKSDSIDIELLEPTDKEKQFIEKTRKLGNILGYVNNKVGVNWAHVLHTGNIIQDDGISELTQISKEQISFHKLISDVNIVDKKSRNKSLKDVNDAKLPEFFEPERKLLLLELKDNPATDREYILKEYPGYKWNIESGYGGKILLRHKDKSPRTTRPRTRIPVSNPRGNNRPNEIDVNQVLQD